MVEFQFNEVLTIKALTIYFTVVFCIFIAGYFLHRKLSEKKMGRAHRNSKRKTPVNVNETDVFEIIAKGLILIHEKLTILTEKVDALSKQVNERK